jgi:hypothetical protein
MCTPLTSGAGWQIGMLDVLLWSLHVATLVVQLLQRYVNVQFQAQFQAQFDARLHRKLELGTFESLHWLRQKQHHNV